MCKVLTCVRDSAGLEAPLCMFHAACEGDLQDVAVLFKVMSGQMLPPQMLCQFMGVAPEQLEKASRENPIKVTAAQLMGGVAAALDENDSAAMYIDKIRTCAADVTERKEMERLRNAMTLDACTAASLEARLLKSMQDDAELIAHLTGKPPLLMFCVFMQSTKG